MAVSSSWPPTMMPNGRDRMTESYEGRDGETHDGAGGCSPELDARSQSLASRVRVCVRVRSRCVFPGFPAIWATRLPSGAGLHGSPGAAWLHRIFLLKKELRFSVKIAFEEDNLSTKIQIKYNHITYMNRGTKLNVRLAGCVHSGSRGAKDRS